MHGRDYGDTLGQSGPFKKHIMGGQSEMHSPQEMEEKGAGPLLYQVVKSLFPSQGGSINQNGKSFTQNKENSRSRKCCRAERDDDVT